MSRLGVGALLLLSGLAAPPGAAGQLPGIQIGLQIGYSRAGFSGEPTLSESREGSLFGVFFDRRIAGPAGVQLEFLLAKKGGGLSSAIGGTPVGIGVQLVYVEIPLLARVTIPTGGALRPSLFGGGAFALNIGCDFQTEIPGQVLQQRCDEAGGVSLSSTDVSAIAGGGIVWRTGGSEARLELRRGIGLEDVTPGVRNRVWALLFGITF